MSLSSVAARRPIGTLMLYVCVVVLGIAAGRQLTVDLMPEADMPRISVTTVYQGVAPEEIETLLTRPIEQSLSTIEGVERLFSTSSEGTSRVELWFTWGKNLDEAVNDVREQLDRVRQRLPDDAETPGIWKFNLSDYPVAFLGLSGGGDVRRLRYLAEEALARRMERVPGVAAIDVRGGRVREIQVLLDPDRLAALGITPREVSAALARENRNVAAGDMLSTGREVLVRTVGQFKSVEDVAATVVGSRDGRPIHVRDLGPVRDSFQEIKNELWIDGEPGMRMMVSKQSGANTVAVVDELKREIDAINRDYEGRLRLAMLWDGSAFIRQSVRNVQQGALYGAVLAILVLLVFLRDLRSTLIIGAAIPISVLATVALMFFAGITLNVISLGGIALGVGMLVDNSIVVLENVFRKRQEGASALAAAIDGSREVGAAILAGTLTTVSVFLPVVFLSGMASVFFREMAVVVCFSLLCSLVVALTLVPALAASLVSHAEPWAHRGAGPAARVLRWSDGALSRVDSAYGELVSGILHHPWRVIAGSAVLLAACVAMIPLLGFELMPEADEARLDISMELPVGTPVEETMAVMQGLERQVRTVVREEEMLHLVTMAGPEAWWRPAGRNRGSMEIVLVPVSKRERGVEEIATVVRQAVAVTPGASIQVRPSSGNMMMRMMRGGGERLSVEIRGHDLETANRLAQRALQAMTTVPGLVNARIEREEGLQEERLSVDRARLAELGLSGSEIADTVEHYVLGRIATRFREGGDEYDVRVQLQPAQRERLEQLSQLPVVTPQRGVVPLGAVTVSELARGPASIVRENQERLLRISATVSGRALGDVAADLRSRLAELTVPEAFTLALGGEVEEQQEIFSSLLLGVFLALFLVYTVMCVQFESLVHPLVIMTAVPFGLIGVTLALALTGTTLNMNSLLGCIVLVGIVVNNAIVLVDYVNLLRREHGMGLEEALSSGARRRLRPILMTTLTTVLGLVPLAIGLGEGAEIQAPLARVIVGGLATSTLITLVFVPCLYWVVERHRLLA
ncbi:MAG TPA: efflux RND transporter permease subunit, partial [Thermoanaerobaculia bacterium]|nr:efflux RND transporter permease subunit [Thermoanaerobaculia bacterium]